MNSGLELGKSSNQMVIFPANHVGKAREHVCWCLTPVHCTINPG
jgi:hypothetical protein